MTDLAANATDLASPESAAVSPDPGELRSRADATLSAAVEALLNKQNDDGHWCAELEGDSILQSEYILMKYILRQEDDPRIPKIAAYLRRQQREDGTWGQYPGSGMDLSATVKGYFVLKILGDDIDQPHMAKAREAILAAGGAERCNTYTKFYLAALGQISYAAVPSIPPEIMYLPKWFYIHLDKFAAWTRKMVIALSIVVTGKPVRELPAEVGIDELYVSQRLRNKLVPTVDRPHPFWTPAFNVVFRGLRLVDKLGNTPWRRRALDRMEKWILEHLDRSEGLGAIFPPMVYMQVGFQLCRGYDENDPVLVRARKELDDFMIEDPETGEIRLQPCFSPVWDTGIAAYALSNSGYTVEHPKVRQCADWLLKKECREPGDWVNNMRQRDVKPAGWFFEYENGFYPDVDDTVMVAMALKTMGCEDAAEACERGIDWVLAMQNDDGGWAAFDRDAHGRDILEYVPFADHNAMQDPSCPDITGRTLECLGHHGYTCDHPAVARAIEFVKSKQEPDGCWFGRWGVNYIYGTWQSIGGLRNVGYDMSADWVQKAGQWLKEHQKPDGSFGESCDTYEDPSLRGTGPSTASQTAWAVMSLMTVFGPDDEAVHRGIQWLCETQTFEGENAGGWDEEWFTGTGFPRVFYLRYHLYRLYFPVMAIGRWLQATGGPAA